MSPAGGKKRSADTKSLTPVNIKQVLGAEPAGEENVFQIDGRNVNQVSLVALVLECEGNTQMYMLKVNDGSGTIPVKIWKDSNRDPALEESKTAELEKGRYLRIVGTIKMFQGTVSVQASFTRPITDFNEITFHMAETMFVHRLNMNAMDGSALNPAAGFGTGFGMMMPSSGPAGLSKPIPGMGQKPLANNQQAGVQGQFTAAQRDVVNFIMRKTSPNGTHINEIISSLKTYTDTAIRQAIDYLSEEGHIYSTIDDEHFKFSANN